MGDVFISYKQEERERMRPIADGLRDLGVDVWFDERLQPDRSFTEEIQHLIKDCRAQLVCWSPAAVSSEWVRGEAEKGRQRGVLIAAMIVPCELPPPFNMHHAENLVDWTGDVRHMGWRKVCDAIGRKIDRPGLGELAALQTSSDASVWKKWAQKFPHDPHADAVWAKAEELEIGAARERMAKERDAARRAADTAERQRAAAPPPPRPQPAAYHAPPRRGANPFVIGIGVGAVGAVAAAVFFVVTQQQRTDAAAPPLAEIAATPSAADASACAEIEQGWAAVRYSAQRAEVEAHLARAAACPTLRADIQQRLAAIGDGATQQAAVQQPAAPQVSNAAAPALAALRRISARDWSFGSGDDMTRRVIAASSVESLRQAAVNNAGAQTVLGMAYGGGTGVARDDAEAVRFYRLAAAQGFARAQRNLANMYQNGRGGLSVDHAESARWNRLAADQGNAYAQTSLGVAYGQGRGVSQSDTEALRLYRLAADQGYALAKNNVGIMYRDGRAVTRDPVEALRWFRMAADQGNSQAQINLGYMYEQGQAGLTANIQEAARYYRLAADQGNALAQSNMGTLHREGRGVPQSDVEAVRYYRLAADQGDANGQTSLGYMYENGRGGLTVDLQEAIRLYRLAAQQGNTQAQTNLQYHGQTW